VDSPLFDYDEEGNVRLKNFEVAVQLHDDLIRGFSQQSFQFHLRALAEEYPKDSPRYIALRTKLFLSVQNDILVKYGFEKGMGGVMRMIRALNSPHFDLDPRTEALRPRFLEQSLIIEELTHPDVGEQADSKSFVRRIGHELNQGDAGDRGEEGITEELSTSIVQTGDEEQVDLDREAEETDEETAEEDEEELEEDDDESPPAPTEARQEDLEVEADVSWLGPRASFKLCDEILPMPLESEEMTPAEITDIWEKRWGIQLASRIRFVVLTGSRRRYLHAREDFVPLHPIVVELEAKVGSILYALASKLKEYRSVKAEQATASRVCRQKEVANKSTASGGWRSDRQFQTAKSRADDELAGIAVAKQKGGVFWTQRD